MQIRLANLTYDSIVDGPGLRMVIWMQGCTHNCPFCHNPQTHDLNGGYLREIDDLVDEVNKYTFKSGITISGGDPFEQKQALLELTNKIKDNNIWVFTGYLYEDLLKDETSRKILENIDVLVDGPFVNSLKSDTLVFKGSTNQRIINVVESLKTNSIVLFL